MDSIETIKAMMNDMRPYDQNALRNIAFSPHRNGSYYLDIRSLNAVIEPYRHYWFDERAQKWVEFNGVDWVDAPVIDFQI
jgi:hypothetical protein